MTFCRVIYTYETQVKFDFGVDQNSNTAVAALWRLFLLLYLSFRSISIRIFRILIWNFAVLSMHMRCSSSLILELIANLTWLLQHFYLLLQCCFSNISTIMNDKRNQQWCRHIGGHVQIFKSSSTCKRTSRLSLAAAVLFVKYFYNNEW